MRTNSYQGELAIASDIAPGGKIGSVFAELYAGSPWLTITGILMLIDSVVALVGLALDPTMITGAPAWLKPLKFGISTSIFSFTIAYIIGHLVKTHRLASIVGRVMAVVLVPEIALIDMQAARHTSSHFNLASTFDSNVFAAMGVLISVVLLSTLFLFIAAYFERFADGSLGLAVRLSLSLALLGMGTGVLMTLPTPQQLAEAQKTGAITHSGAHTVGGQDGDPSMPITGWSADHGDLRIAHFVGLHAMQGLLLAWWLTRGRANWPQRRQILLVLAVGAGFTLAFFLVLWQALRGQPILRPDALTLSAWTGWLVALVLGLVLILKANNSTPQMERHS
jgi:hypothetical protein